MDQFILELIKSIWKSNLNKGNIGTFLLLVILYVFYKSDIQPILFLFIIFLISVGLLLIDVIIYFVKLSKNKGEKFEKSKFVLPILEIVILVIVFYYPGLGLGEKPKFKTVDDQISVIVCDNGDGVVVREQYLEVLEPLKEIEYREFRSQNGIDYDDFHWSINQSNNDDPENKNQKVYNVDWKTSDFKPDKELLTVVFDEELEPDNKYILKCSLYIENAFPLVNKEDFYSAVVRYDTKHLGIKIDFQKNRPAIENSIFVDKIIEAGVAHNAPKITPKKTQYAIFWEKDDIKGGTKFEVCWDYQ